VGQQNFPIGGKIGKKWVVQGLASRRLGTLWVRPPRLMRLLEFAEAAVVVLAFEIQAFEN
jgi:hypothetical protein